MSDTKRGRAIDVLVIVAAWAGTVVASDQVLNRMFHFEGDTGFTIEPNSPSSVAFGLGELGTATARLTLELRSPGDGYTAELVPSGIPLRVAPEAAAPRVHIIRAGAPNDSSSTPFFSWPGGDRVVITRAAGNFQPADVVDWMLSQDKQSPDSASLARKRDLGRKIQFALWIVFIAGGLFAGLRSLKRTKTYRQFSSADDVTPEALVDLMISTVGNAESSKEIHSWLRLRVGGRPFHMIQADSKIDPTSTTPEGRARRILFNNTMLDFRDWLDHCAAHYQRVAIQFPKRKPPADGPGQPSSP